MYIEYVPDSKRAEVIEFAKQNNGITSFQAYLILQEWLHPGVQKSAAERILLEWGFWEHHNEWWARGDRVYFPPEE